MAIKSNIRHLVPQQKLPEDIRKEALFQHFKAEKGWKMAEEIAKGKYKPQKGTRIDILLD